MQGFFIQDIKRSFLNKGFLIGLFMVTGMLLKAVFESSLDGTRSSYDIVVNFSATSGFGPFAGVFPALAYASIFCEEYQSGYIRMIFARMRPVKFGILRMISVALSGGTMLAIPIGISFIIALNCGIPGIPQGCDQSLLDKSEMLSYLEKYGDWSIAVGRVMLAFLFGCAWALVGLAFAVWISNRYVALIAPFVLYESLWMALYDVPILNPIRLLRGEGCNAGVYTYPICMAVLCVYLLLAALIVIMGIKRRFQNE